MSKLLLLYAVFITGLVYLVLPDFTGQIDFFPFYDMKLNPATHIYFICEKLTMIALAYIIYNEATEYRAAIQVFFLLLCADLVDYLLFYGAVWGYLGSFPISMNVLKCFIFGLTILYVWTRKQFSE